MRGSWDALATARSRHARSGVPIFFGETVAGAVEMLCELAGRVEAAQPEVVLLPDEPYPFSAEDLPEFHALDVPAARKGRIHLVDGKLLTWYGPRMAGALLQVAALLRF